MTLAPDQFDPRAYFHRAITCQKCPDHPHPIVTIEEAAFLMGISRRTMFRWLAGDAVASSNAKILRWLDEHGENVAALVTDRVEHAGDAGLPVTTS